MTAPLPPLDELTASLRVVALPLRTRFRGVETREIALLRGPAGWGEFAPFLEYDDLEAATWLAAAIEAAWEPPPAMLRDRIPVNATVPAVPAGEVAAILDRTPGVRTAKVKVAERGQTLADDVDRVRAARRALGSEGRVRVDANGAWNVDEAEHAAHALAEFDLEYLEQPCASIDELAQLRERLHDWQLPIAADESVRKAEDPLAVARAGAADLLVLKVAPLGGARRALRIAATTGLPVVVSSAIDSSVGLAAGARLAAALPELPFDCGLGTAPLLAADVALDPLAPVDGAIAVREVVPDPELLARHAAPPERAAWWRARVARCHALLSTSETAPAVE